MKRVIAGTSSEGRGTILIDGPAPRTRLEIQGKAIETPPGFEQRMAWASNVLRPDATEMRLDVYGAELPPGATRFSNIVVPAGGERVASPMHRTPHAVSYVVVVSGRMRLDMEDGTSSELGAGDLVVQLGAMHRWVNVGEGPAMFAVLGLGVTPDGGAGPSEAGLSHTPRVAQ